VTFLGPAQDGLLVPKPPHRKLARYLSIYRCWHEPPNAAASPEVARVYLPPRPNDAIALGRLTDCYRFGLQAAAMPEREPTSQVAAFGHDRRRRTAAKRRSGVSRYALPLDA
jgi:hypothetical protein